MDHDVVLILVGKKDAECSIAPSAGHWDGSALIAIKTLCLRQSQEGEKEEWVSSTGYLGRGQCRRKRSGKRSSFLGTMSMWRGIGLGFKSNILQKLARVTTFPELHRVQDVTRWLSSCRGFTIEFLAV
jgi:hypothetical protein